MAVAISPATSPAQIEIVRSLLREYAEHLNRSLGEQHICLQEYEREVAGLPGAYAAPHGMILLADAGGIPAGCAALKPLRSDRASDSEERACEMKRLWVRPEFRSQSVGLALAAALIDHARGQGYTSIYLDTVPAAMQAANRIYRKLGFRPVARYNTNPVLGQNPAVAVEFFRLSLLSDVQDGRSRVDD